MELCAPLTQERRNYTLLFGCLVALFIVLAFAHTFYSNDDGGASAWIVGRETVKPKEFSLPLSSASPSIQQTTTETNSSTYNQKCDMEKTKWFIFSRQRSGTHWLMGLLASYGFRTMGELFMKCPKMRNATNHILRQAQSLNGFILQRAQESKLPWILKDLKGLGYSSIFLKRRDALAAYISGTIRQQVQTPANCKNIDCASAIRGIKLFIKPEKALKAIKRAEDSWGKQLETLKQSGIPYVQVVYEELGRDTFSKLCSVLSFLQCPCFEFDVKSVIKNHDQPKSSYVSNWEEVKGYFKGTAYEWMVGDEVFATPPACISRRHSAPEDEFEPSLL